MAKHTVELIGRMQSSYLEYFAQISDDPLLHLSINPVLVTIGAIEIQSIMDMRGTELVAKAKGLLVNRVMELMRAKIAESDASPPGGSDDDFVETGKLYSQFTLFHSYI